MAKHSTESPIIDLIGTMTEASLEATGLDAKTLMMVRFAALIGVDAPPVSYMMNLAVGKEVGLDEKTAREVLLAVMPIVGTPHMGAHSGSRSSWPSSSRNRKRRRPSGPRPSPR
jgi:hypothetical protein